MSRKDDNQNPDQRGKKYERKSGRILAWSDLFRSLSKLLWLLVIVIALVAVGRLFLFKSGQKPGKQAETIKKPVTQRIQWDLVNRDVQKALVAARESAETTASTRLDLWIEELMGRVDDDFLKWYFNYWTQQGMGLKSLLYQVVNWIDSDQPTPAERITEQVQEQFSVRVLRPQIAQLEIERIVDEIVSSYASTLKNRLEEIPAEYEITPASWDRYLNDLAVMTGGIQSNRQTSLSLKAFVGITAAGTVLLVSSLRPLITRVSARLSSRLAVRASSRLASKTGAAVGARMGGRFLGSIIAIGIIIWDVWDHHQTVKQARPVLRNNIFDYLKEMKQSILYDSEFGILTAINGIETGLAERLEVVEK